MIYIENREGQPPYTKNVFFENIQTHITANDFKATEALILQEYHKLETEDDPIAFKFQDPTEGFRFIYDEVELAEIKRIDPGLIEEIQITYF